MQRALIVSVLVVCGSLPASAQQAGNKPGIICPEGTFNGQCVNPLVASAGRTAAIAFTQAQISLSGGHPYAASADTTYAYPNNVAGYPPLVTRQTLFGNGTGAQGVFDRGVRGE